jgi:hypothetical protein
MPMCVSITFGTVTSITLESFCDQEHNELCTSIRGPGYHIRLRVEVYSWLLVVASRLQRSLIGRHPQAFFGE